MMRDVYSEVEGQQIEMPTTDKLKFKHHFKKLRCPFVVFQILNV